MSDITKKIFSIEPAGDAPVRSEPSITDVVRPLVDDKPEALKRDSADKVPEFVTREAVTPLNTPPAPLVNETEPSKAAGWVIIGLGVLYLIGAGLYFGLPLVAEPVGLLSIAGLVLLLTLPLVLLCLLWLALRHLRSVSLQNARLSKAADILVSPDSEALARTESLAAGIRAQISKVNSGLSDTVEALKGVQIAVTRESQALDAAGATLSKRSDDVGQNLTLQRQALESLSGTFDTRISTLSTEISEKGKALDEICTAAETKILSAGEALQKASAVVDETATSGTERIGEKISSLEETSRKLAETADTLTSEINSSTETLLTKDGSLIEASEKLEALNAKTQSQISDLQATIGHGYEMLAELKASSEERSTAIASYYDGLSDQLKLSEDSTLAAQGQTARMVEANLAQMRRDFSRMETDLQSLQVKLNRMRDASDQVEALEPPAPRLNLKPLESDFPPVEPPHLKRESKPAEIANTPLNLGADMEIKSEDDTLINFKPDVIRRPGDDNAKPRSRGFGRRQNKDEKSGWRWRDMLGTLERPVLNQSAGSDILSNSGDGPVPTQSALDAVPLEPRKVDGAALLTALQLSPAAIVDEGTVVDATQARINSGEPGLTSVVTENLPEAVTHLKDNMAADATLKADLLAFTTEFSKIIGNTPPTAPALRAAFGSPEGRAYLLCAAAFRPELRG